MVEKSKKFILQVLGLMTTALAFIGLFLPILPTTPFLLLSAFLFSKSNKKFHDYLLSHKVFGPIIGDWERAGVIRPRAKLISSIMIVGLFSYTLIFVQVNLLIKSIVALSGLCVLLFILTRPSHIN